MKIIKLTQAKFLTGCIFMTLCTVVSATEMVYTPVNPSFGGNPNNAPGLLSVAQAQNHTKAPVLSAIDKFNQNLENAILTRLSTEVLTNLFGSGSTLVPGTYDTGQFTVTITQGTGNLLTITTTDKNTGATATFTVDTSGTL